MKIKIVSILLAIALVSPVYTATVEAAEIESVAENQTTEQEEAIVNNTKVNIVTKDVENSVRVAEAEVIIQSENGEDISFEEQQDGSYKYSTVGTTSILKSDSYGRLTATGLPVGKYKIIDNGALKQYVVQSGTEFTIKTIEDALETSVDYVENVGSLTVHYVDSDDDANIEKGRFVLKDNAGKVISVIYNGSSFEYTTTLGADGEFITKPSGTVTVTGIPVGTYTLEQVYAPLKYNSGLVEQTVTISTQKETSATIKNWKLYGDVQFEIVSSLTDEKLSGYEFKISDKDGNVIPVHQEGTNNYYYDRTGASPVVKVDSTKSNLTIIGLPVGKDYTLRISDGIDNYKDFADVKFSIQDDKKTTAKITAKRELGSLKIVKKDKDTKDPIEGFKYSVLDAETKKPLHFSKNKDGEYVFSLDKEKEIEFSTNEDGIIEFVNIPTGDILIEEVSVADGYMISKEKKTEETIAVDKTIVYEKTSSKSNCALEFVDKDGDPIQGVNVKIHDKNGEVVFEGESGTNGFLYMSNITNGAFTYEVVGVPSQYSLPLAGYEFKVDEFGLASGLSQIELSYSEIKINTVLVANPENKDEKLDNVSLAGCEYTLTNEAGETFKAVTNEAGEAVFLRVPHGTYKLVQTKTIDGIEISKETVSTIKVDNSYDNEKNTYEFKVMKTASEEKQTTENIPEPKFPTGLAVSIIVLILGIISAIIGVVVLNKKKEGKEQNVPTERIQEEEPQVEIESDMNSVEEAVDTEIVVPTDVSERKPGNTNFNEDPFDNAK